MSLEGFIVGCAEVQGPNAVELDDRSWSIGVWTNHLDVGAIPIGIVHREQVAEQNSVLVGEYQGQRSASIGLWHPRYRYHPVSGVDVVHAAERK
jgi:hypothetical protein